MTDTEKVLTLNKKSKPVIAVDLDEVLGQFLLQLIRFHNDTYSSKYVLEDFCSYQFKDVWGGSEAETMDKVHAFFESEYFADLPLVPGAHQVLTEFVDLFTFAVVTSRQNIIEDMTRQWIDRHYPGIFSAILFGNHYGFTGTKRSKPDMCADIGAIMLIDDSLLYAKQCAEHGIKVLLFDWEGKYMWSKSPDPVHDNIKRIHTWDQVRRELDDLSRTLAVS
mmetsp:Transcript_42711/g.71054  ORF Transcript_42711/g.71054 Transcript_42711/m.71054 type:complete len:221 (+) Transcript_42711:78-740(+)